MIHLENHGATIVFEKPISSKSIYPQRDAGLPKEDHEAIAKQLSQRSTECTSVIVIMDPMRDDLVKDPQYMKIDYDLGLSDLRRDAVKAMQGKYPTVEEVRKLIRSRGLPTKKNNYDKDQTRDFYYRVENEIYQAYETMLYPSLIFQRKDEFRDDYMERHPKAKSEDLMRAWRQELMGYLLPQPAAECRRIYNLPEPLNFWDDRNLWQQWYFVDHGDEIRWSYGGSGGSSQRENHGRWAHVFLTLNQRYNSAIPLYCFRYTDTNELKPIRRYECFKAIEQDLTGNYPADHKKARKLFRNRLLKVDYRKRELSDVRDT